MVLDPDRVEVERWAEVQAVRIFTLQEVGDAQL